MTAERMTIEAMRTIWPRHTRKHASRRFRVAIDTAKRWLVDGVPHARRADLADVIDSEIGRMEREIHALLRVRDDLKRGRV